MMSHCRHRIRASDVRAGQVVFRAVSQRCVQTSVLVDRCPVTNKRFFSSLKDGILMTAFEPLIRCWQFMARATRSPGDGDRPKRRPNGDALSKDVTYAMSIKLAAAAKSSQRESEKELMP